MAIERNVGSKSGPDFVRVVYCVQGGGRTSMKSQGLGVNEDICFTINAVDVHAVCYRKTAHPSNRGGYQGWEETAVNDTLNIFDNTESRTSTIVLVFDARGNGGV